MAHTDSSTPTVIAPITASSHGAPNRYATSPAALAAITASAATTIIARLARPRTGNA